MSLVNIVEDIVILINIIDKDVIASSWQLNDENGEYEEIDTEIIDIQKNIFKRLGGLGIRATIEKKKIVIVGLGSVGSTAAAHL